MMNCKRAKLHIALCVGDDLDDKASQALDEHVQQCPSCRKHWQQMLSSFHRLQQGRATDDFQLHESLWPDLLDKLPASAGRLSQFNGWWAALAVSLACVALLSFWQKESHSARSAGSPELPLGAAENDPAPRLAPARHPLIGEQPALLQRVLDEEPVADALYSLPRSGQPPFSRYLSAAPDVFLPSSPGAAAHDE